MAQTHTSSSSQAIRPPTSLLSLPSELLSSIVSHLGRPDAIAFALTARTLFSVAASLVTRHLDLFIHPHLETLPPVEPYAEDDELAYHEWEEGVWQTAEGRRRRVIAQKIRAALCRGGERRMGMVEELTISSMVSTLHGTLLVLELVSTHLRALHIRCYHSLRMDVLLRPPYPAYHATLDYCLISSDLHFPALTHIHIGDYTLVYTDLLLALCAAAPNLTVLIAENAQLIPAHRFDAPAFPHGLSKSTKLLHLRVPLGSLNTGLPPADARRIAEPVMALLDASPEMRQAYIHYLRDDQEIVSRLAGFLSSSVNLVDLYITIESQIYERWFDAEQPIPAVRRLVLNALRWSDVFWLPPRAQNLEVLILNPFERDDTPSRLIPYRPSPSASTLAMMPHLVAQLKSDPRLHSLLLANRDPLYTNIRSSDWPDHISSEEHVVAHSRSLCCAGEEVFHASYLLEYSEVADEACDTGYDGDSYEHWDCLTLCYTSRENEVRQKSFVKLRQPVWTEYTDLNGLAVPLEVIEEVRRVEGATEAEWRGRGIEVGEAAWRVLTDWEEKQRSQVPRGDKGASELRG